MQTITADAPRSFESPVQSAQRVSPRGNTRSKLWIGRVLSGLALLFFAFDCAIKLAQAAPAIQGTTELGYPAHSVLTIGIIQLICVVLYAVPRTAALGAILLTGYLGGAVATHLRVESPLFSHILSPIYFAALVWGGLYLRDSRLALLLPFAQKREL